MPGHVDSRRSLAERQAAADEFWDEVIRVYLERRAAALDAAADPPPPPPVQHPSPVDSRRVRS